MATKSVNNRRISNIVDAVRKLYEFKFILNDISDHGWIINNYK